MIRGLHAACARWQARCLPVRQTSTLRAVSAYSPRRIRRGNFRAIVAIIDCHCRLYSTFLTRFYRPIVAWLANYRLSQCVVKDDVDIYVGVGRVRERSWTFDRYPRGALVTRQLFSPGVRVTVDHLTCVARARGRPRRDRQINPTTRYRRRFITRTRRILFFCGLASFPCGRDAGLRVGGRGTPCERHGLGAFWVIYEGEYGALSLRQVGAIGGA